MPTDWKINGVTFAARQLTNVQRQCSNMATDRMTFEAAGRAIDAGLLFSYDQDVAVTYGNTPFFRGRAGRTPKSGSPSSEGHSYEILGPWDQLERLTYQQRWKIGSWSSDLPDATWVWSGQYKSRLILGQKEDGTSQPVGAVIREVLAYAMECGVTIASGTIEDGPLFPWEEVLDLSCAEAIRRVARWCPQAVGFVDYSTTVPTFQFTSRAAALAITLTIPGSVVSTTLSPAAAFGVPCVCLKYERTTNVDGQSYQSTTEDRWPPTATGREIGAVIQTIAIDGGSSTAMIQRQKIVSHAVPNLSNFAAAQAWFLAHDGSQEGLPGQFKTVSEDGRFKYTDWAIFATRSRPDLPYELVKGSLQDWMRAQVDNPDIPGAKIPNRDPHNYNYLDDTDKITFLLQYNVKDQDDNLIEEVRNKIVIVQITATDCRSGHYSRSTVTGSAGDAIPTGLARALYEALNANHYQGTVQVVGEEVSCGTWLGKPLLITGGDAAWSTMSAIIQSVSDNLDTGSTTIEVGPPDHLTPSQVLDLRRANRARRPAVGAQTRTTGETVSGNSIEIGSAHPKGFVASFSGPSGQSIEVISQIRFDSETNQVQIKTRRVAVQYAEDESDWTLMEGGQAEKCDE